MLRAFETNESHTTSNQKGKKINSSGLSNILILLVKKFGFSDFIVKWSLSGRQQEEKKIPNKKNSPPHNFQRRTMYGNSIQFAINDENLRLFAIPLEFVCIFFVCRFRYYRKINLIPMPTSTKCSSYSFRDRSHFSQLAIQLFTLVSFCLLPSVLFIICSWKATRGFCNQWLQCRFSCLENISRTRFLVSFFFCWKDAHDEHCHRFHFRCAFFHAAKKKNDTKKHPHQRKSWRKI